MAYTAPLDEKQLIADLRDARKSRDAFGVVMRQYGEQMYWQIRKMVASHDDANDLLQNCFIKAWNNLGNFRGEAKLSTWLYKIAVNESINFLNREKARAATTSADDDSRMASLEADPWFDGDEVRLALQKAVAKLPEKQRIVFNMRYFDEMKYEEMSEILGTSVGALKASYHHAVKKIEEAMSGIEI